MTKNLSEIVEIYQKAKVKESNPQDLTPYVIEYFHYRNQGLLHKPTIQLMRLNYFGEIKGNKN